MSISITAALIIIKDSEELKDFFDEYTKNANLKSKELSSKIDLLIETLEKIGCTNSRDTIICALEAAWVILTKSIVFNIIEKDQVGSSIYDRVTLIVTNDMIENNDYKEVIEEWNKDNDLNSFSSHYYLEPAPLMEFYFIASVDKSLIGFASGYQIEKAYLSKFSETKFHRFKDIIYFS